MNTNCKIMVFLKRTLFCDVLRIAQNCLCTLLILELIGKALSNYHLYAVSPITKTVQKSKAHE